jgi:[phosphatase 2A protein]-leucine-carboxy methyltransferase
MHCAVGDDAVRATNDDASECKRCAVNLGYWDDKFINSFVKAGERKAPEINRGYYARCTAVALLVDQFLQVSSRSHNYVNKNNPFHILFYLLLL